VTGISNRNVSPTLVGELQKNEKFYSYFHQMSSPDPIFRCRLTRKFFDSLPSGCFLASNILRSGGEPWFAEYVTLPEHRDDQWKRVKAAGADQRTCDVFPNEQASREWLK
jgi:hypothetical protein